MITGHILDVRGGEVVVQAMLEPTDVDGSELTLPEWPAIDAGQASTIILPLKRLLTGQRPEDEQTAYGSDGHYPVSYHQAFYPRTVALCRRLESVATLKGVANIEEEGPTIPYFWEEVMRILGTWGSERPSSFDVLARLEVRLMDLTEMTRAGAYHSVVTKGGYQPTGMADFA